MTFLFKTNGIMRRSVVIATVAILTLNGSPSLAAPDPRVVVVSPASNTTFRPGDRIRVRVEVDPSVQVAAVIAIADFKSEIAPLELFSAPFEGELVIPNHITGSFGFGVGVITADDNRLRGPEIAFRVIPAETPIHLEVTSSMILSPPNTPGGQPPDSLGRRTISVMGDYGNDIERDVGGSLFGTTYTSSNPSIATVDAQGVVVPVAPGIAYVVVEHKGVRAFTEIKVKPISGSLPPIDQTAKVSIQASGFRLDRTKGMYVQQVTITNQSALPLPKPLKFILVGLPANVRFVGTASKTENIAPLGSPWQFIDLGGQEFFSPANSVTVNLEFRNDTGVPITYTPVVYTVMKP
jgi:hypothetical protein